MRTVIVNADDFGLVPEIDEAVLRGHAAGLITSATLMPTGESAVAAAAIAAERGLGVGLHFTLTHGEPVGDRSRSLVGPDGRFLKRGALFARALRRQVRADDVERELEAQWSRVTQLGVRPTHIDGHQHIQVLPTVNAVVSQFARTHNVPVRIPFVHWRAGTGWYRLGQRAALATLCRVAVARGMPALTGSFTSVFDLARPSRVAAADYVALVQGAPKGTLELMVHPSLVSQRLAAIHPDLYDVALAEARLLVDPQTARAFRDAGIQTVGVDVSRA